MLNVQRVQDVIYILLEYEPVTTLQIDANTCQGFFFTQSIDSGQSIIV